MKGHHALTLEPITPFRFADLPADIRCTIYSYLLEEDTSIKITTHTPTSKLRRPVRFGFRESNAHRGQKRNKEDGKWIDIAPSNASIVQVLKQLHKVAAAILYGGNKFELGYVGELPTFLKTIGDMTKLLQRVSFPDLDKFRFANTIHPFISLSNRG